MFYDKREKVSCKAKIFIIIVGPSILNMSIIFNTLLHRNCPITMIFGKINSSAISQASPYSSPKMKVCLFKVVCFWAVF